MPRTSTKPAILSGSGSIPSDTERREPVEVISESGADKPPQESRMNQIARRAHELYEARGGNAGKALEDWLQAEREIDEAIGKG